MAPPANDNFANAITLSGGSGSESGTVFEATREGTESSTLFGGTVARSVWYKWTCPASGWYKFFIEPDDWVRHGHPLHNAIQCGIDVFNDGVLTAHTSTSALAQSVTINNTIDNFTFEPQVAYNFTSGNVYYIRLASQNQLGYDDYSSFDFVLQWVAVGTEANDPIAGAEDVDPLPATVGPFTTRDAVFDTSETFLSNVGTANQSLWWKFTPTASGRHAIIIQHEDFLKDNADQDRVSYLTVQIGTVSGATFTPVSGSGVINKQMIDNDPPSDQVQMALYAMLTSGVEYHVIATSGWTVKSSSFGYQFNGTTVSVAEMVIEEVVPPVNDNFASPTNIDETALPVLLTGQTVRNAGPEAGEDFPFHTGDVQAVWYDFTPDHNGKYRFRFPVESLEYAGDSDTDFGNISIALSTATTVAGVTGADFLGSDQGYTDPGWINVHSPTVVADLTSGVTYRIIAWSEIAGTNFNRSAVHFDLAADEIFPPSNDDFADRITITGASGTEDVVLIGATTETDEPPSFWWNEDETTFDQYAGGASVWYQWTCPSTGWYEFKADFNDGVAPDLAIYTGSALNALTPVARNSGGTMSETNLIDGATTIKFHATSATSYKIQVAHSQSSAAALDIGGPLTWATASAPEGDTTDFAVIGSFNETLVDNFGNTDDELPPDWLARLTPHGSWWYNDGQVGRSKWFKFESPGNVTLTVAANQYAVSGHSTYCEYALLAYTGNDFASLVAATTNAAEDGVMMGWSELAETIDNEVEMEFDLTTGEVLWLCMVGTFDMDYNANASGVAQAEIDAPQTEIHLTLTTGAPPNDDRSAVVNVLGQDPNTWLGLTQWTNYGDWFTEREAMQGIGTTFGASTQSGDPNIAGFTATRTVWFMVLLDKEGEWKFWVESAVDAVLGIYAYNGTSTLGTMIAEDDDSGPGNQPEIIRTFTAGETSFDQYWIGVDTKTEGDFVFKCQRQSDGTPPANDDVADAVVISSVPFSQSGTTVGATCEPAEMDSVWLGLGPKDTVWYKFVAPANGMYQLYGTCDSNNWDGYFHTTVWKGTTVDNLEPMPEDVNNKGWFDFFDTFEENKARALVYNYEAGQTYFIRVETEEGGSEDFTIYFDDAPIYINIQASGSEEFHGTMLDDAEVYVNIQALGTEIHHISQTVDAATVTIDIQPSGIDIIADEYLDTATVYINIQNMGGECYSAHTGIAMDAEADPRWIAGADVRWQTMDVRVRWEIVDVQSEGVHC